MRVALALLATVAIAAPLASAGPSRTLPPHISWADAHHRHGWAPMLKMDRGGWCPSRFAFRRICATEDGGKHWRGILYGDFNRVSLLSRSSSKAGMVVAFHEDRRYTVATLDNGRHWYGSGDIFATASRVWVNRQRIYWSEGPYVYRLKGWPAKARASCTGGDTVWARGIHAPGPARNVCWLEEAGGFPAGTIRGVASVLIRAPDTSISSWADEKHGFATDPAGPKWRCAPPGARDYVVTLCGTNNGGKSWWLAYSQEWRGKSLGSVVQISDVWRGPSADGAFDLSYSSEGAGADTVFVTHDGGASWQPSDAFFAGLPGECDPDSTLGTVCARGVHFHQVHDDPLQLTYDLGICISKDDNYFMGTCGAVTYVLDGWPNGALAPVLSEATVAPDGSGMVTTPTRSVTTDTHGNTIVFTYRVAGLTREGALTLAVPDGWSSPSLDPSAAGYTTSSAGTVSTSGRTITVSGLTLTPWDTLAVTYGSRAAGGPGATAPAERGATAWALQERSASGGVSTDVFGPPVIAVTGVPHAPNPASATAVSAGGQQTCALTGAGGARCWGHDAGRGIDDFFPVDVSGLPSAALGLATGWAHACALVTGGGVKCWGDNSQGQLGDGTTTNRATPVDVIGLSTGVQEISAGTQHTCALLTGGSVKCWGGGYLGDGANRQSATPVDVVGLDRNVTAIAAGGAHTCAVTGGGGVKCWGSGQYGQLGNGSKKDRLAPVAVTRLSSGVRGIGAGGDHTCAVTEAGGVECWGLNTSLQLGDGTGAASRSVPVRVVGLSSDVLAVSAGGDHTCALVEGGGVKCWGSNSLGQLGNGTSDNSAAPLNVQGLALGVAKLDSGTAHACAVLTDGRVECWGWNSTGQLGDGTSSPSNVPVDVAGFVPRA